MGTPLEDLENALAAEQEAGIITDDPQSRRPIACDPVVFEALAGETLMVDPFRAASGALMN